MLDQCRKKDRQDDHSQVWFWLGHSMNHCSIDVPFASLARLLASQWSRLLMKKPHCVRSSQRLGSKWRSLITLHCVVLLCCIMQRIAFYPMAFVSSGSERKETQERWSFLSLERFQKRSMSVALLGTTFIAVDGIAKVMQSWQVRTTNPFVTRPRERNGQWQDAVGMIFCKSNQTCSKTS